ncbi:hypothetical protein DID96_36240 [Burkholderia sp. Bp8963]|uniref:hypothetical protein n=1 Tax=Burkholderia sp. Bp8963 TaxID=2184547 RepID=UPI000F59A188|nr:hypothetical protein [Burkholderia sp. Bp8963]RQS58013.1 hypothetical protein DID96_36240 [Burkholderia sp. Bp8963]
MKTFDTCRLPGCRHVSAQQDTLRETSFVLQGDAAQGRRECVELHFLARRLPYFPHVRDTLILHKCHGHD